MCDEYLAQQVYDVTVRVFDGINMNSFGMFIYVIYYGVVLDMGVAEFFAVSYGFHIRYSGHIGQTLAFCFNLLLEAKCGERIRIGGEYKSDDVL